MSKKDVRFLGVTEAARALEISAVTLKKLSDAGRIACVRGAYDHRFFDPAVIAAEKQRRDAKRQKTG